MRQIAILGTGPMGIYTLKNLAAGDEKLAITFFEASDTAGIGMPYDPMLNADYMLCNAFSREIPALDEPLIDWLRHRPKRELSDWELSAHDLTARAFYPRVLIGEYLKAQFGELCEKARNAGHRIRVNLSSRVLDISIDETSKSVVHLFSEGSAKPTPFDAVIIATGHSWSDAPEIDGVKLISPWPYTNITALKEERLGILGSSLSAIDIVVALGHSRGRFEETSDHVRWFANENEDKLHITMVSHMGIMPEGDFYYPFPYEPLKVMTQDAIEKAIAGGPEGLLERTFELLCQELDVADPNYLDSLDQPSRTLEGFAPAYFSHRQEMGGLRAVKRDLKEARESLRRKETIPHRYALLRAHEAFDQVLRKLTDADYKQFLDHLMPVFADCYAAVPHLSLARIVALYDAGVLNLVATLEGAAFSQTGGGQIEVDTEDGRAQFDVVLDARGQGAAGLKELSFPSLVNAICNQEAPLTEPFVLQADGVRSPQIFCLALPQILERHPFSQGLVECSNLAKIVAQAVLQTGEIAEANT